MRSASQNARFLLPAWRHLDLKYVKLSARRSWAMKSKGSSMICTARRASTAVKLEEGGSTTGADRRATLIRRSSSARSLGNSLLAGAMGISVPFLITPRRFEPINEKTLNQFLRSHGVLCWKTCHLSSFSIQYIMELTFTQAAKGVNKEISVNVDAACQHCDGKGHEPGSKVQRCPACSGSGMVRGPPPPPASLSPFRSVGFWTRVSSSRQETVNTGPFVMRSTCRQCGGKGTVISHPCRSCRGRGQTKQKKTVVVPVPAGQSAFADDAVINVTGNVVR